MNILVVDSSAQGEASVSRALTRAFIQQIQTVDADAQITIRDVGTMPVPHLVADTVAGIRSDPQTEAELGTRALSDELVAELREADLLVIGAPMYNFGIPSTLKAWFDHVLRARITFRYTEAGPEGLLKGKRAVVIETRAGVYSNGPAAAHDHQEAHLRSLLGFMGITDVAFVRAEGMAFGPEAAEQAIETAREQLRVLARQDLALAA
jgi:FMN-dependent NADH-azoreductase